MRLSELLHSDVFDDHGGCLGSVEDVRLVQDGPLLPGGDAALRIDALVIGRAGLGLRLGYVRTNVRGPWLLKVLFHGLAGRASYVEWSEVEAWDDGKVRLRPGAHVQKLRDVTVSP